MAMVKLCCRLVSCYGKERLASRTANAIACTRHDHILKGNVKPEPVGAVVGTYGLLSCVQNISSCATSDEKDKLLENAASKKSIISNEVLVDEDEDVDAYYLDAAKFAVDQHNHKNGTQLKFVELGKSRLDAYTVRSEHVTDIYLKLKVIDEKGKVEYVKAELAHRGGSFESAPLLYVTNQFLRIRDATISECFSDDCEPKF